MSLTLASVALGGLNAPAWAWIATLLFAGLCLVRAAYLHNAQSRKSSALPFRPGDLARQHTSPRTASRGHARRVYGGAAIGVAIRQQASREEQEGLFQAVEAEIATAQEETAELAEFYIEASPNTTPTEDELEVVIRDWRAKTTDFISTVLGPARRAAFKTATSGKYNAWDCLEAERKVLIELAQDLSPDAIRVGHGEVMAARTRRQQNMWRAMETPSNESENSI